MHYALRRYDAMHQGLRAAVLSLADERIRLQSTGTREVVPGSAGVLLKRAPLKGSRYRYRCIDIDMKNYIYIYMHS